MRTGFLTVALIGLALVGCEDPHKKAIDRVEADRDQLGDVTAAVNEVVRNQTDCDVAQPLMVEAYQKVEAARGRIQGNASGQTLEMLKSQIDHVARLCGSGPAQ
jgi:hypothetical protein